MMIEKGAGEIVELVIRRQDINISELSRKMHVNRRTMYNWFRQKTLARNIILSIGIAINYDFSRELTQIYKPTDMVETRKEIDTNTEFIEDDEELVFVWIDRYITLLDVYKKLLLDLEEGKHL